MSCHLQSERKNQKAITAFGSTFTVISELDIVFGGVEYT